MRRLAGTRRALAESCWRPVGPGVLDQPPSLAHLRGGQTLLMFGKEIVDKALFRRRGYRLVAVWAVLALAVAGVGAYRWATQPRLVAAVTGTALVAVSLLAAAVLVPWRRPPISDADRRAVLADLPPEHVAPGKRLSADLRPWRAARFVVTLAGVGVLGLTPLGAAIVDHAAGPFGGWIAQAVAGGLAAMLALRLLTLPPAVRAEAIMRRYGLSTQTWTTWIVDLAKSYAVGAVLGGPLLLAFYTAGRLSPRWWWIWASLAAAAFNVLVAFVFPVLIAPVFNKFTPMADGPLRTRLLALAAADAVPVRDVRVADASRRTTALNAYVAGVGPTRQVVVYDTLLTAEADDARPVMSQTRLAGASDDEVVAVVAHELAHCKSGDLPIQLVLFIPIMVATMCGLYLLDGWAALLHRAEAISLADPHSVGLLLLANEATGWLLGPATALMSRRFEARADQHALDVTGDAGAVESVWRRISAINIADVNPGRLARLSDSHPTIVDRIAAARAHARRLPPVGVGSAVPIAVGS